MHSERCTPGSGTGAAETTAGNCGIGAAAPCSQQPLILLDRSQHRRWHPDFMLPGYNGLIIEYAGMPDVPDYAAGIRHKQYTYAANGIPALFVYPEDLKGPNWPERLHERIRQTGEPALRLRSKIVQYEPSQVNHL